MAGKIISQSTDKKTVLDVNEFGAIEGVYSIQRADPILSKNKAQRNANGKGARTGSTQEHWRKVADIPEVLYYDLVAKFGKPTRDNWADWSKWLNDYDNRFFRTTEGKV